MSKIVLIKRFSVSDWVSCRSITSNLEKSYIQAFGGDNITTLHFPENRNNYSDFKFAKQIKDLGPSSIVFIDHTPHPASLILSLDHLYQEKITPKLVFHIFGDFTLQTSEWITIEYILKKSEVLFICASSRQKTLLENLIDSKGKLIQRLPFPIDQDFFFYDEKKKSTKKEKVFLYTGRLSTQKNINSLIRYFNFFNQTISPSSKLIIAGPYDDLGTPFIGKHLEQGSYAYLTESLLDQIKNPNIQVLPNQNHHDLRKLYHQADYFISLSLHNDEDYGMSPAEALSCGLPCILSDWGGYPDFSKTDAVDLIPINTKNSKLEISSKIVITALNNALTQELSSEERKEIGEKTHQLFSINYVARELKSLLRTEDSSFKNFRPAFKKVASSHKINKVSPYFRSSTGSYSSFYFEIYNSYLKDNE